MSTYSTQRQSGSHGEHAAAHPRGTNTNHRQVSILDCPVLLRIPDVSKGSLEENFRHTTPLEMQSALENIGTASVSQTPSSNQTADSSAVQPTVPAITALNTEEQAFASLLAASPAFHSKGSVSAAHQSPVLPATQVTNQPAERNAEPKPKTQPQRLTPLPEISAEVPDETPASEPTSTADAKYHRTDKPAVVPVRRRFRVYRPLWMPEVPPTLVLGALICFSAILVGMLWRGDKAEFQQEQLPVVQEEAVPNAEQSQATPRVAEVPAVPEVPAAEPQQTERPPKTAEQQPKAQQPSNVAEKTKSVVPEEQTAAVSAVARENTVEPSTQPTTQREINSLPPVEPGLDRNFYGRTLGGPEPQYVNNPHVGNPGSNQPVPAGQGPVYEARRPAAEFQGMITKPDATGNHERY